MMRRGRQAADDGSFARSVGVHTARGALLIGVAVLLGIVLLQKVDSGKSPTRVETASPTAQQAIAKAGYNALAPADATVAAKATKRNTIVYYAAGFDSDARKIAPLLNLNPAAPVAPMPTALPVSDLKGANILVLVGPDFGAARSGTTTIPGPTTTTTRRL
jgi:hypothetical protein